MDEIEFAKLRAILFGVLLAGCNASGNGAGRRVDMSVVTEQVEQILNECGIVHPGCVTS